MGARPHSDMPARANCDERELEKTFFLSFTVGIPLRTKIKIKKDKKKHIFKSLKKVRDYLSQKSEKKKGRMMGEK